jgi:hypothetical protein
LLFSSAVSVVVVSECSFAPILRLSLSSLYAHSSLVRSVLDMNPQVSGTLPDAYGNLAALKYL